MTSWVLTHSEISPMHDSWGGSWKRVIGDFYTTSPMTPTDFIASARADIAAGGKMILLDCALYVPSDETALTDHYYVEATFGPNPSLFPQAANEVTPEIVWWIPAIIGAIGTWGAKSMFNNGGSSTSSGGLLGGITSMIQPIMMIMMLSMMMPMMQNMMPKND